MVSSARASRRAGRTATSTKRRSTRRPTTSQKKSSPIDIMGINNPDMQNLLKCSDKELTRLKLAFKAEMQATDIKGKPFLIQRPKDIDANGARRKLMWKRVASSDEELREMLSGERWANGKPAGFKKRLAAVQSKIQRDLTNEARRRRPTGAFVKRPEETGEDSNSESNDNPASARQLRKRNNTSYDWSKATVISDDEDVENGEENEVGDDDEDDEDNADVVSPNGMRAGNERAFAAKGKQPVAAGHSGSTDDYITEGQDAAFEATDAESSICSTEEEFRKRKRAARDGDLLSKGMTQRVSNDVQAPALSTHELRCDPRFLAKTAAQLGAPMPKKVMARRGWHGLRPFMGIQGGITAATLLEGILDNGPGTPMKAFRRNDHGTTSFERPVTSITTRSGHKHHLYADEMPSILKDNVTGPPQQTEQQDERPFESTPLDLIPVPDKPATPMKLATDAEMAEKVASVKEWLGTIGDQFGAFGKRGVQELLAKLDEAAPVSVTSQAAELRKSLTSMENRMVTINVEWRVADIRSLVEESVEGMLKGTKREP